jgi:lipid-A-disaccharide synthase
MVALKKLDPRVEISGVGGEAMAAQGLSSLFSLSDTAVMGLREVVPKIPRILARVKEVVDFAVRTRPDAVVLIDSPDFTHRIARKLKRRAPQIATVNYVAPQVWASRAYRAKAMAHYFDLLLALLPFETQFFQSYGLRTVFVGHPVIERAARMQGGENLRQRLGVPAEACLLCVLPGSRSNEIRLLLPVFRDAVALLQKRIPELYCVLPTIPHVAELVRGGVADWPTPLTILDREEDKFSAFSAANAALAASGTVTTELALARTPFVVGYKLGWLTYKLARPFIHAPFATLVNILLQREAVPECIQERCTPQALVDALLPLLEDGQVRDRQIADLGEACHKLGEGSLAPSLRAAQSLLEFIGRPKA